MTQISRTLVLNPVEPAPVSMKFRSDLDTTVDVEYLRQNGAPYNTDFGAQLYLISRTTGSVKAYVMPSTDVINGRARAFIPAGDTRDKNGYNVQIIGSVEGEQRLIARGSASVFETEALGIIPADMIDHVDVTFAYNEDVSLDIALWQDASKSTPYNVIPPPVTSYIWDRQGGTALAQFNVLKIDDNVVRLTLTAGQTAGLPYECWWSLSVSATGGLTTLVEGHVLLTGTPLPVWQTQDFVYTYVKQAALVAPASGDVIHSDNALDLLRVSRYDDAGTDQEGWLSRLVPGDSIKLLKPIPPPPEPGPPDPIPETLVLPRDDPPPEPLPEPEGTKWTIISVDKVEGIGYYQFVIDPAEQSPETGDQHFVFAKG